MNLPLGGGRRLGFRAYLLQLSAVPLALVVGLSTLASYYVARTFADRAFDASLFDTARALAQQVEVRSGVLKLELRPMARSLLEFDPVDKVFYEVKEVATGRLIAHNAGIVLERASVRDRGGFEMADGSVEGRSVRAVRLLVAAGEDESDVEVVYAETLTKRDGLGAALFAAVFFPQLLIAGAAGLLIWFGVRSATQPLETLASDLLARTGTDLRPVASPRMIREVRLVAFAVNRLIRRLRRSALSQQAFIGNAAHQLRTPLAGIAAQIERMAGERDPAVVRVALGQLQIATERASRLVGQLLTLARSGPDGEGAGALHPIDLAVVVRDACADWVPEALDAGVDLGYEGPDEGVRIDGDEALVSEMLGNLVGNAIRYGARPGVITVRLTPDPLTLAVENEGSAIPETEVSNLFKRFYRVPGSPGTGSGLGLAIVREIAALHGARVSIRRAGASGGTIAEVQFERLRITR